jgi:pimeloyl-ACP methyl ester carboxylesterase
MKLRRKRFELMVFEPYQSRLLVGDDIGPEGSSELFLCLPGLLETRQSFDQFAEFVGDRARVMTVDWCGRGDSDRLPGAHDYRMSVYLSDLSLFYSYALGAAGSHARIHIVGTSMGGLLGVVLASQRPKRLGSLILNDVGPTLPWSGVFSLMTGLGSAKSSHRADIDGVALAEKLRVDPNLLRAVRQPAHLDLAHETRLSGVDFSATFAAVTVPMLLLRGMESEIINDRVVKRIFELHPLTRIHECKKSGHPVLYSKSVTDAILKFAETS